MNAPEKIGKYRITGVIGEGVSGVVYKAFDPSLQRVVAVKSLHLNVPVDARGARAFAGRLGEQAQAIARVNHPGIVTVHQIDEADGRAYVAMEHVAGLNLAQWLSVTPLPPQAALLQVMDQLLDALECAHHAGVRHGDVKLTNVHHHQRRAWSRSPTSASRAPRAARARWPASRRNTSRAA